jgi:site-specific DNA recombinase
MVFVKTAIYLRQSIDRDHTKLAISRQREDLLKLCAARGWDSPVEYVDNNVSANTGRRIAYHELCDDIRGGAIGRVAVWDLDRLHRQPAELETFITLADQYHVELASVGGDADLSTPSGRLFARMKGTVARYETEHKSARQLASNRQRAKNGKTWAPRMFGYIGDEIIEHEADAIRKACTAVLSGASMGSIATQWNNAGLLTTRSGRWSRTMVKRVLIRPRNAGLQTDLGEILEDVEVPWQPIIERDMWEAVCAILTDPKRHTGAPPGRKYLLSGIAVCGKCGLPLRSGLDDRKHGREPSYVCAGCKRVSRNLAKTDAYVIDHITRRLAEPDAVATLAPPTVDTAPLRDQIAALRTQITQAEADYDEGLIDARRMNSRIERATEKLAPLEAKMLGANTSRVLDGLAGHADAAARFAKLPLDRRRAVINALVRITIHPQGKGRHFDPTTIVIDWIN